MKQYLFVISLDLEAIFFMISLDIEAIFVYNIPGGWSNICLWYPWILKHYLFMISLDIEALFVYATPAYWSNICLWYPWILKQYLFVIYLDIESNDFTCPRIFTAMFKLDKGLIAIRGYHWNNFPILSPIITAYLINSFLYFPWMFKDHAVSTVYLYSKEQFSE